MTDPVAKLHLIQKSSKMYRVYLHEQVQYLKTQENFSSEGRQHGLEHKMELFTSWELVWHLCEILYIERLPAGCLMQQLLMWVTWHSHHVDSLLAAVKGEWDVHPHYWDAVFGLVFQGRMKEACQLLENHSGRRDHGDPTGKWPHNFGRLSMPFPKRDTRFLL
jgi:nuclear pore complex protein Nup85